MSLTATSLCAGWLVLTTIVAAWRGRRGFREGRGARTFRRLRSPTIYLFAVYLLLAGVFTPRSPGETTTPLVWLGLCVPVLFVLATLSSVGNERPRPAVGVTLAILHGGAVVAAGALILAIASPRFLPLWLR